MKRTNKAVSKSMKKKRLKATFKKPTAKKKWVLVLYIAGQTPRCIAALDNLTKFCDEKIPGQYSIKVIDLVKNPHLAKKDQIFAIPTIIRKLPKPIRKAVGDFSNATNEIIGLNFYTRSE